MTSPAPQLISDTDLALSLDPAQTVPSELQPARGGAILAILPGLLLAAVVAISGYLLRSLPGMSTFSPMILAILLGTAFHNLVGTPAIARPGVTFSQRRLLRIAIILLGL